MRISDFWLNIIAFSSILVLLYTVSSGVNFRISLSNIIGGITALAGLLFWIWSLTKLGRHLTPAIRPKAPILITSGPFSVVRHPVYLGSTVFFTGLVIIGGRLISAPFLLIMILVEIEKARREESELIRIFPEYVKYQERVGFLLPKIKNIFQHSE